MKAIKNVNIILPDKIIDNGAVIFAEKIKAVDSFFREKDYSGLKVIDGGGAYLSPGFINIHIHGAGGMDTMEATTKSLNKISQYLIKNGVTAYLPTTMTMELEKIYNALDNIKKYLKNSNSGARVLGVHLEGPFINEAKKGAQSAEYIINPSTELFKDYLDIIKVMTLAVEKEGALEVIEKIHQRGIISSLGHSDAEYEEVMEAQNHGLSLITHLYNAMSGLHHRQAGIVGAALNSNISCEIIADGIHIDPAVIELTAKIKTADQLILVTDAMEASGLDEGEYNLGGQKVSVKNGSARLEDGTLAGSVLTMDQGVRNMLRFSNLELPEVIRMATYNPARLLNLDYKIGQIKVGLQADFVLLDKDLTVKDVYLKGERQNI
ncbi:N-acetylglucosamine-6-phosphate deacetylase [Halanaerobium sp. Z-7514]|uniref:N-acetylglucosamine-6-phosphate deacetylase n=1 Tax=Halanaerobium polyolivorans TaxID=2886943 RepID=A0AAW4X2Q2_9FIRM|nr:N-acetylglucosamine-6-phosphate deacetylase [Halanaerobium polyolivorans]MCC3146009.1 N-acetylglucosamine-6-phosphate deacetylase [Halanaerobium polyolivorans]RQD78773.1 MAG: N-acetylglucosamine-6-phosphate deacetylase [Halanaerobium sp. MSAO_Bac5]